MSEEFSKKIDKIPAEGNVNSLKTQLEIALNDSKITPDEAKRIQEILKEVLNPSSSARKEWKKLSFQMRKDFQKAIGTSDDGAIGKKTMSKLSNRVEEIPKKVPAKIQKKVPTKIQEELVDFYTIPDAGTTISQAQRRNLNIVSPSQSGLIEENPDILDKHIDLSLKDKEYIRSLYVPVDLLLGNDWNFMNTYKVHETIVESQALLEDFLYEKFDMKDSGFVARILFTLGMGGLYIPTGANSSFAIHEFGHGTTAENDGASNISYEIDGNKGLKLSDLFLEGVINPFGQRKAHYNLNNGDNTSTVGAGINTNNYMANLNYQQALRDGEYNAITKDTDYLFNKLYPAVYTLRADSGSNDMSKYLDALKQKGYDVSKGELQAYSFLSAMLSGGTLSSLKNIGNFVFNGERSSDPIGFEMDGFTFYLPEVNTWMNSENFSVEVLTYIKHQNTMYELGMEAPVIGEGENVYTLGIEKKYGKNIYKGVLKTDGDEGSLNLGYSRELTDRISLGVKGNFVSSEEFGAGRADRGYGSNSVAFSLSIKF